MLRLNTRTHSTIGNIRNAIRDDRRLINERDVRHHSRNPTQTVQVLRKEHASDNAVVALGVLDLKCILQHEARGGHGEGEAEGDFHYCAELRAVGFPARATARHTAPTTLVTRPVVVEHATTLLVGHETRTPHRVAAVQRGLHRGAEQIGVPLVGQLLAGLENTHVFGARHGSLTTIDLWLLQTLSSRTTLVALTAKNASLSA